MPLLQNMKIYPLNPTDTTVEILLMEGAFESLVNESRLPGGFWVLSFRKPMTHAEWNRWVENRFLYRVVLEAQAKKVIWEGRLEEVEGEINAPTLKFRGYWSNFLDAVNNNKTYVAAQKSYNTTADAILKHILDNGFHANTEQIDTTDQSNIGTPGVTIDKDYALDWSMWRILTDSSQGVLSYPDSSDQLVDLAVWEDRLVYLSSRNPSTVDWRSYIGRGVVGAPFRYSFRTIANAVSAVYGATSESAISINQASIDKYIRREVVISDIGTSTAGPAASRADGELARRNDIQQETDLIRLSNVWDANGKAKSLCEVRAGDVFQIPNLIPTSSGLAAADLDAKRTFVIEQTTCDHRTGILTIRPDRQSKSLSAILARAGLG